MLEKLLLNIGMTTKEVNIYMTILNHHQMSVMQISSTLKRERTSTYKLIIQMCEKGYLFFEKKGSTILYHCANIDDIMNIFDAEYIKLKTIHDQKENIIQERNINNRQRRQDSIVQIYEGTFSLQNIFNQIENKIYNNNIINIKLFASRNFTILANKNKQIDKIYSKFIKNLITKKISIYGSYGEGMDILQSLVNAKLNTNLDMPNNNGAICIRIIQHTTYVIIFKKQPYIIKIESIELSNLMHLISETLFKTE